MSARVYKTNDLSVVYERDMITMLFGHRVRVAPPSDDLRITLAGYGVGAAEGFLKDFFRGAPDQEHIPSRSLSEGDATEPVSPSVVLSGHRLEKEPTPSFEELTRRSMRQHLDMLSMDVRRREAEIRQLEQKRDALQALMGQAPSELYREFYADRIWPLPKPIETPKPEKPRRRPKPRGPDAAGDEVCFIQDSMILNNY